ncbi:nucleotidyltransferase domain-containing protein [Rossellomorea aquimaris]|uniref:nucleotidyltransferase domain-containing protein n=1 Tax=Rossellomorea aquimaris TaxID=189382 RepID=UPI0007D0B2C5|nr:nucleotidyltransferase domain-containing protein [Rossellomorea aquimaris]
MGFGHKFNERDASLVKEREKLRKAIKEDLIQDEYVLAFFYGGSLAKGNYDDYSDLDLRIVVKEEVFEAYRKNKKERAKCWGDVLYYEDFPWAVHTVAHFKCFIKVDVFYYKPQDLKASLHLKEVEIEYDPFHIVKNIHKQSNELHYMVTLDEFEIWRSKFFAHMHEVYRRVKRGEIYYALHSLDHMRWSIAAGWNMERDILPNPPGDWSKYEGKRSTFADWQISLLKEWGSSRSPEDILIVMKGIVPEFKRVHSSICRKLELEEQTDWVDEVVGLVL